MDIDYRSEENQNIKSGVAGIGCGQSPHPTHTSFSTRRIFSLGPTNLNQRSSATILLINGFLVVVVSLHLLRISPHILIATFLLCFGIAIFLWGIVTTLTSRALVWMKRILETIASWLEVSILQPLLLITGLSISSLQGRSRRRAPNPQSDG